MYIPLILPFSISISCTGSRNIKVLDKTMVCLKTGSIASLQKHKNEKQPLGWYRTAYIMPNHRTAQQKRRFLFQAISSAGPINLGATRTRQRDNRCRRSTIADRLFNLSCTKSSRG